MQSFRRMMIALVAMAALAAATPAFAQDNTPPPPPAPTTPAPAPRVQGENEQGLGFFIQGGFLRTTSYGANGQPLQGFDNALPGWLAGVSFGGNKSGWFGLGVDLNYMEKGANNVRLDNGVTNIGDLKLKYIDVPIWGRVNFFGHHTKNAPTLYVMFGGFVDILLQGKLNDLDVKDSFNGFDAGALGGIGFEVARIGIEFRGNWAFKTLVSTGGGTFLNGVEDSKALTWVLLVKVRIN